jgi:hypothetical protein
MGNVRIVQAEACDVRVHAMLLRNRFSSCAAGVADLYKVMSQYCGLDTRCQTVVAA